MEISECVHANPSNINPRCWLYHQMAVDSKQGLAATIACFIAAAGFLGLSLYPPPESPTSDPTFHLSAGPPFCSLSVQIAEMQTPAGPTIMITVKSAPWDSPITRLSATLEKTGSYVLFIPWGANRTISFSQVNQSSPLLPGKSVSQEWILIGGSLSGNNTIVLSATSSDGWVYSQSSLIK